LSDLSRLLKFKEKWLSQAESSRSYKACEQVSEEITSLKSKVTELQTEGDYLKKKEVELQGGCCKRKEIILLCNQHQIHQVANHSLIQAAAVAVACYCHN